MVYKSHGGEFINRGLFTNLKGLLCGNPTERGESLILNFWPHPGTVIVCRKRGASGQQKIQYIKYLHCQFLESFETTLSKVPGPEGPRDIFSDLFRGDF